VLPLTLRALIQFSAGFLAWGGILFWAAGTLRWSRGWIQLLVWAVTFAVDFAVLLRMNRPVLAARLKFQRGTEKFDMIILLLFTAAAGAIAMVAGLDAVRFGWSALAPWWIYPGVVLHSCGNFFTLWAMVVNPHAEKTVRIQADREHRVISSGPYAMVRHPMYSGIILMLLGMPLVLGSLLTFVPVGVMVSLLIIRTVLEERMLLRELSGYGEYVRAVPYRLFPWIW